MASVKDSACRGVADGSGQTMASLTVTNILIIIISCPAMAGCSASARGWRGAIGRMKLNTVHERRGFAKKTRSCFLLLPPILPTQPSACKQGLSTLVVHKRRILILLLLQLVPSHSRFSRVSYLEIHPYTTTHQIPSLFHPGL